MPARPHLAEQTVTLPLHVNVVPGDEAAGRVPDPKVRTELLFQRAKRRAADALRAGDACAARDEYRVVADEIAAAPRTPEPAGEARVLAELEARVAAGEASLAAKLNRMEHARKSRQRGRRV